MTTPCVWLTGRAGAGKTTIARGVVAELRRRGRAATMLDESETSAHLNGADPIGSLGWLAGVLVAGGSVVVIAGNTPERAARERVRDLVPGFVEVFVDGGPGTDDYEEPFAPELRVPTLDRDEAASTAQLVSFLEDAGVFPPEA